LAYARRLNAELATPFAPTPRAPSAVASDPFHGVSDTDRILAAQYGVRPVGDRFHCRGYTFTTLGQALHYVRRLAVETQTPSAPPSISTPVTGHVEAAVHTGGTGLSPLSDTDQMLAVLYGIERVDGGFRCRDYRFATLAQALDYARRLNADVAPISAAQPRPVQPRPTPPAPSYSAIQPAAPAQARQTSASPVWYGAGSSVTVGGMCLESPMIYTGVAARAWEAPRYLVDPTLQTAPSGEDRDGVSLGYWPSYQGLTPVARHTYLQWLALGRPGDYGIGYVFMFFYGLEHRLLREMAPDGVEVIAEVDRLLALDGDNGSFRSYARRLISAISLIRNDPVAQPELSPDLRLGEYEIPFVVRRYLGVRLATGTEPARLSSLTLCV
jgi:hypothetical protein